MSVALVVTVATIGAVVGARSYAHLGSAHSGGPADRLEAFGGSWGDILLQNVGAALLAFSGVLTFGLSTLVSLMLTSTWVGATAHAAIAEVGLATVTGRVLPYAGFEFAGLLLSAAAGALPAVSMVVGLLGGGPRRRYSVSIGISLRLLYVGLCLLVVGAAIEALLIARASR